MVLRLVMEVLLVMLALATVYLLVHPFKDYLRDYVLGGIGNSEVRALVYGLGYTVYKLGQLSYLALESLGKLIYGFLMEVSKALAR